MQEKNALIALLTITIISIGGITLLLDDSTTGAISGQQTAYSRIYGPRYHANPCSYVQCSVGTGPAISYGYDPITGNLNCGCQGHGVAYYQISHWTKQ